MALVLLLLVSGNARAAGAPPQCGGPFQLHVEVGDPPVGAGSCFDDEGDDLTITITQPPQKGTAEVANQGTPGTPSALLRYAATSVGADSFTFRANDGSADSNEVTVTTDNVAPVNDPPQCGPFQLHAEVGDPPVDAGSCFDDERDDLTITITLPPLKGTAEVANQGTPFASVRYSASSLGADSFTFRANDGSADSNEVTVTTDNVAAVNDPPQCGGSFQLHVEVGDPPVGAGSCFDDEGDDLTITITQPPLKGTAEVANQGTPGTPSALLRYAATSVGADSFTFRANDGSADSNEVTVTTDNVAAVNDPPQCGPFQLHAEVGDPPVGAGSCFDDERDDLTITITQPPLRGTAEVANQGTPFASVRYSASSLGADSFKFRANDGSADSNEVTVTTDNVAAVNDPPQCGGSFQLHVEVGDPPVGAGSCFDDEGDDLTITITLPPLKGTAEVANQGTPFASVRYSASSLGADSFTFRANDGSADSNELTVTTDNVAAVNDPPQCGGRSSCTWRWAIRRSALAPASTTRATT